MNVTMIALHGARLRQATVTNAASNIFASGIYSVDNMGISAWRIQNNSASDMWMGFDDTVTVSGGANPGILIPANGELIRQYGAKIVQAGVWLIGTNAGGDSITIEEAV